MKWVGSRERAQELQKTEGEEGNAFRKKWKDCRGVVVEEGKSGRRTRNNKVFNDEVKIKAKESVAEMMEVCLFDA